MAQYPISEHSRLFQKFDTCRTAFMLCDVQERVAPHMENFQNAVHAANAMGAMHTLLGPQYSVFIVTEQYPKGVGHVHHDIVLPADAVVAEKLTPSMLVPKVRPYIFGDEEKGIPPVQQVIIFGHETYGCVLQTTDELLTHGIRVAVLVDGCGCLDPGHHTRALLQLSNWEGVLMTTVPSVIMQLTRSDPRFVKDVIKVLKKYGAEWAASQPEAAEKEKKEILAAEEGKDAGAASKAKAESGWTGLDA